MSLPQFRELTGEGKWPDDLAPWIRGDVLEYLCNGRVDYRVRGIHVRLEVRWDWQAEQGDDTHHALYRGTRCRLAVRQGPADRFRPELYVLPDGNIGAALQRRIAGLQSSHPGIAVETFLDRNGGSRYPRRYGSAMTPLSGPLPAAFSRGSPIRRRCRRARGPIYSQNTG